MIESLQKALQTPLIGGQDVKILKVLMVDHWANGSWPNSPKVGNFLFPFPLLGNGISQLLWDSPKELGWKWDSPIPFSNCFGIFALGFLTPKKLQP